MGFIIYARDENSPTEQKNYLNLYAIASDQKVYITERSANLSLFHVNEQFGEQKVRERIEELGGSVSPAMEDAIRKNILGRTRLVKGENGNYYIEQIGGVDASFHFIVDTQVNIIHVVSSSFPAGNSDPHARDSLNNLILEKVFNWLREKGYDARFRVLDDEFTPHTDYRLCQMRDMPGVINYIERNNIDLEINPSQNILLFDCSIDSLREMAESQIGYSGENMISSRDFMYRHDGNPIFMVQAPFIFINSANLNTVGVTRAICSVLVDTQAKEKILNRSDLKEMSVEAMNFVKKKVSMDIDSGKSIGEAMHEQISGAMGNAGNIVRNTKFDRVDEIISAYGADGDKKMEQFIKSFMIFITLFKSKKAGQQEGDETTYEYGQYYYFCKAPEEIQYREFFDQIFVIVSTAMNKGRRYDCLMSKYSIPIVAVELFGYDVVNVSKYVDKMGVLFSSIEHNQESANMEMSEARDEILQEEDYNLMSSIGDIVVDAVQTINPENKGVERQMSKPGVASMLSDFPLVFTYVREMFDEAGIEFTSERDIPVTLIYNDADPGNMGSYSLMSGSRSYDLSIFSPPEITLNVFSMKSIEQIAQTLIHEASHYVDDLKTSLGIEPNDFMSRFPSEEGGVSYWESYLGGYVPSEFRAHVTEVLFNLAQLDREYVRANQEALKIKYIRDFMGQSGLTSCPLVVDAEAGNNTVRAVEGTAPLKGRIAYDIAEAGAREEYVLYGTKRHETVGVDHIDEATDGNGYIVSLTSPLKDSYRVSDGAALWFPPIDTHPVLGTRQELYGNIVNTAFEHYLSGGSIGNAPSQPIN